MRIPKGYTEEEVVGIIENIGRKLGPKFKFGYHTNEDMSQIAAVFAWQGISDKYDENRPLENFLWIHVRNRLFNHKRDHYGRPDVPCKDCPLNAYMNYECTAFDNINDCEYYAKWDARSSIKRNLMSTKEYSDTCKEDTGVSLEDREIYELIDRYIPADSREDWVRFTNQSKLPKHKREFIIQLAKDILEEHYGKGE